MRFAIAAARVLALTVRFSTVDDEVNTEDPSVFQPRSFEDEENEDFDSDAEDKEIDAEEEYLELVRMQCFQRAI